MKIWIDVYIYMIMDLWYIHIHYIAEYTPKALLMYLRQFPKEIVKLVQV
jgi:hypothetical protein